MRVSLASLPSPRYDLPVLRRMLLLMLVGWLCLSHCSRPLPPRVTARGGTLTAVDATGLTVEIVLDVENPNSFALATESVGGEFTLSSPTAAATKLARVTVPTRTVIPAGRTQRVVATARAEWQSVGQAAALALAGRPIPWTFAGKARFGTGRLSLEVPFSIKGQLTPEQLVRAGLGTLPSFPSLLPPPR